mgnify:CR=1 FL=1
MTVTMTYQEDDLPVLQCWRCEGTGERHGLSGCPQCLGTGKLFWANGYGFPYSPEGEKRARAAQKVAEQEPIR